MQDTLTQSKNSSKCRDKKYILSNQTGKLLAKLCSCFLCNECDGEGRVFHQNDKGEAFLSDCSYCFTLRKRLRILNDSGIPGKFASVAIETYQPIGLQNKRALSRT